MAFPGYPFRLTNLGLFGVSRLPTFVFASSPAGIMLFLVSVLVLGKRGEGFGWNSIQNDFFELEPRLLERVGLALSQVRVPPVPPAMPLTRIMVRLPMSMRPVFGSKSGSRECH